MKREEASAVVVARDMMGAGNCGRTDEVVGRMGDSGNEDCAGQKTPPRGQA